MSCTVEPCAAITENLRPHVGSVGESKKPRLGSPRLAYQTLTASRWKLPTHNVPPATQRTENFWWRSSRHSRYPPIPSLFSFAPLWFLWHLPLYPSVGCYSLFPWCGVLSSKACLEMGRRSEWRSQGWMRGLMSISRCENKSLGENTQGGSVCALGLTRSLLSAISTVECTLVNRKRLKCLA